MLTAGTAYSQGQAVLTLFDVIGNGFSDEFCISVDEFLGHIFVENVVGDFFVVSGKSLKGRNVVRIRNEPGVDDPVRFLRYSLLVSKRHYVDDETVLGIALVKDLCHFGVKVRNLHPGCIDDIVRFAP